MPPDDVTDAQRMSTKRVLDLAVENIDGCRIESRPAPKGSVYYYESD